MIVKGAIGQLNDLIKDVNECNLRHGIQASLDAKLQDAVSTLQSAQKNDATTAFNIMSALIGNVQAQSGGAITPSEAAKFIAAESPLGNL